VQKARASRNATVKENDLLRGQLEKRAISTQANLKRIVERFREQTKVAIQAATATALQSWAEQAAELQVLRADKANRDLRGPRFWKLDQANCEAVQKNLTTDLLRLALSFREEITKLLEFQDTLVNRMRKEMETVAEPVKQQQSRNNSRGTGSSCSRIGIRGRRRRGNGRGAGALYFACPKRGLTFFVHILFGLILFFTMGSTCRTLSHGHAIVLAG
jgi:hypothetical protein